MTLTILDAQDSSWSVTGFNRRFVGNSAFMHGSRWLVLIKDALHLVDIDHGPDARHAVFYVTRIVNRNLLAFARARSDAAAASLALLADNRLAVRNCYLPEDTRIHAEAAAYAIVCRLDADALEFYEHIAGIA